MGKASPITQILRKMHTTVTFIKNTLSPFLLFSFSAFCSYALLLFCKISSYLIRAIKIIQRFFLVVAQREARPNLQIGSNINSGVAGKQNFASVQFEQSP